MDVGVDEVGRHLAGRLVEHGERRAVGPERVAEAGAHAPTVAEHRGTPHEAGGVRGRLGLTQRQALRVERPLHGVHVVVPQPGDDPRATGVEHGAAPRQRAGRRDVGDASVREMEVDGIRAERVEPVGPGQPRVGDDVDAGAARERHRWHRGHQYSLRPPNSSTTTSVPHTRHGSPARWYTQWRSSRLAIARR